MRKLIIARKKSFVGSIIPYYCIIGINKDNINHDDTQYVIKNGETISINISEQKFCIVVAANTSTGHVVIPPFLIEDGINDVSLELITKYHWIKGSTFELRKK